MQIKRLTLGEFDTNCYILQGPKEGICAVIDPADDGPEICRALNELGTMPEAVLLTHSHFDHILAVPYLQERWPELPVYCHPLDCPKETMEKSPGAGPSASVSTTKRVMVKFSNDQGAIPVSQV